VNVARHAGAAFALAMAASGHAAPAASVTPSGNTVPENLLRIELHLARPLPRPLAMDRVHLLDDEGQDIPDAFLDLPLPGDDGRTIALLLHPGRVKTGVGANLALGRALHADETVTLVVDDPQLGPPLRKRWRVDAPARQAFVGPGLAIDVPRAGTRAPLQVRFGTPLTASSIRLLAVRGPAGERVAGSPAFRDGETAWRFVPARPWRAGEYALRVHPLLEDVAGNRGCAPFEAAALADVECTAAERVFATRP
jgi:hypothetical protein